MYMILNIETGCYVKASRLITLQSGGSYTNKLQEAATYLDEAVARRNCCPVNETVRNTLEQVQDPEDG